MIHGYTVIIAHASYPVRIMFGGARSPPRARAAALPRCPTPLPRPAALPNIFYDSRNIFLMTFNNCREKSFDFHAKMDICGGIIHNSYQWVRDERPLCHRISLIELCHLLIDSAAKMDAPDIDGHTPLHFCCLNGLTDMAKVLVSPSPLL